MATYQLKQTKKGNHTLIYSGESEIRIHSAYDPETEAQRSAGAFEKGRASHMIVSGLGLGYHVAALKERFPDTALLVIERDRQVIELALKHYPAHISGTVVVNSLQDLNTYFDTFDINKFRGVSHYIHRPSYQIDSAFYNGLVSRIRENISSRVSDMLTRFEFEERWIENIFKNIHHLKRSMPVSKLFGAFRGRPGIIVSAGPSLKKNIHHLKKLRESSLIVCVDTAYKVCTRQGIAPHIVMTLDAQKHSLRHFLGTSNEETVLLADVVSYPVILRSYGGTSMLSTTSKYLTDPDGTTRVETTPVMDWIGSLIDTPIGDIQSGGSVATSAFDLLLNLGCDPIVLVGQDLAYTGREIHSSGTHHNDDWLPQCNRLRNLDTINQAVIRKRSIKRVTAYGGSGTVITDFVLDLYRGWFEDSAQRVHLTTINATEGGARIANTVEKALALAAEDFPSPKESPLAILRRITGSCSGMSTKKLTDTLERAGDSINELLSLAEARREKGGSADELEEFMYSSGIAPLVNPFLRKTRFYIERRDIEDEKASEILTRDIITTAGKLAPLIRRTIERMKASQET